MRPTGWRKVHLDTVLSGAAVPAVFTGVSPVNSGMRGETPRETGGTPAPLRNRVTGPSLDSRTMSKCVRFEAQHISRGVTFPSA